MSNRTNSPENFVIASLSILHGSLACPISLIIFVLIIGHYYKNNRIRTQDKIIFILSANIYFTIFAGTFMVIISDIRRLLGDIYGYNFNSPSCISYGYILCVKLCTLYSSFTVQVSLLFKNSEFRLYYPYSRVFIVFVVLYIHRIGAYKHLGYMLSQYLFKLFIFV